MRETTAAQIPLCPNLRQGQVRAAARAWGSGGGGGHGAWGGGGGGGGWPGTREHIYIYIYIYMYVFSRTVAGKRRSAQILRKTRTMFCEVPGFPMMAGYPQLAAGCGGTVPSSARSCFNKKFVE